MPLAGTRLGPYAIGDAIGAGGMGEVYHARDTNLDRDVAIKVLPEAFAEDEEHLARFEEVAGARDYDISPDGQRFLVISPAEDSEETSGLVVVQNWFQELERIAPTGH